MRSNLNRILFFVSVLLFAGFNANAQEKESSIISKHLFEEYHETPSKRRRALRGRSTGAARYNPLTYLAGGMLFIYQNIFSEQISANCTYEISCSENAKLSIEKYGLVKGTVIGLHQLSNCSPTIVNDCEEHMVNGDGKIRNGISYE